MKKIFTLTLLAGALIAQAKVYTLADLAQIVGTTENSYASGDETITETIGISVDGNVYTLTLPTKLADGVSGIGFDDNNIVLSKSYLTLIEGNDLTIGQDETLLFAGAGMIEMSGTLTATNATFGAAEGSEATAKGFRIFGDNTSATISGCTFDKVGLNFGSTNGCLKVEDCTFNEHNSKSGNSAINFTSSCTGNEIKNCIFTDNQLSSVASGANAGVGITITECTITKSITSTRLYPAINLSINNNDIIIDGNFISGPAENTRAGGIAVSNLLGTSTAGTIYVRNNHVQDCSYGITLTGGGNIRIEENTVLNNKYIANANAGGSGINITCNGATNEANAYLRANTIQGNLWGVTVIGNASTPNTHVNAGYVGNNRNDVEFNPGENVFIDNGNGGMLYDWYNNTLSESFAQGNKWNVTEQTEELIENVIVHQADIATLGIVHFMPPYRANTAITDIEASADKDSNRYYNINGQQLANPAAGIYIKDGRKVIVK